MVGRRPPPPAARRPPQSPIRQRHPSIGSPKCSAAPGRPKRTCIVSNVKLISQCGWLLFRDCWSRGGTFPVNFAKGVTPANSRGSGRPRRTEILQREAPFEAPPEVGDRPRFHYDR